MRNWVYPLYMILLAFAATSCERTSNINIELPYYTRRPVLISFISDEKPGVATAFYTSDVENKSNASFIQLPNSSFILKNDQGETSNFQYSPNDSLYFLDSTGFLKENVAYSIAFNSVEFGLIRSENAFLPQKTPINNVFLSDTALNTSGYFTIGMTFMDNSSEKDYYSIGVLTYANHQLIEDSNPYFATTYIKGNAFSDDKFNQQTHIAKTLVPKRINTQQVDSASIVLYHLSPSIYQFMSSVSFNEGSLNDALISPQPVFSNIKNGYGVFGMFRTDTLGIRLR